MTPYSKRLTPLTQRMAEDMLVRNLSSSTIDAYTYHVGNFMRHFDRPARPTPGVGARSGLNRFASTNYISSARRKSVGAASTRRFVAYAFSIASPSHAIGMSR